MKYGFFLNAFLWLILLAGCAGSPARTAFQSNEQIYQSLFHGKSLSELCNLASEHDNDSRRSDRAFKKWWNNMNSIIDLSFERYGTAREYCDDPAEYIYNETWSREEYNINGLLVVMEEKREPPEYCHSGNIHRITLRGMIGPDSSYVIEKLIKNNTPCSDIRDNILSPIEVHLESNGGLIYDGYLLGRILKKYKANTIVKNDKVCASSCAVAFLGGERRTVEENGTMLFHAPYYNRLNALGKSDSSCVVEKSILSDMVNYYKEMTSKEVGDLLFERTMWYCSTDNGWTITGGNAAKLYGIATD